MVPFEELVWLIMMEGGQRQQAEVAWHASSTTLIGRQLFLGELCGASFHIKCAVGSN